MADIRPLAIDDTDSIIRSYHVDLQTALKGNGTLNGNSNGTSNGTANGTAEVAVNGA